MTLLQMSLSAGVMIILIIVLRTLFLNKLPRLTFPILWLIVLIRLTIPFSLETKFSLTDFMLQPFGISTSVSNSVSSPNISTPETTPAFFLMPYNQSENITTTRPSSNWLFISWLLGISLFAAFFTFNYWKSHQKIRHAIPIQNDVLTTWKSKHQLKREVQILTSDKITTPLTVGILKPKIILPVEMLSSVISNLDYMLEHEFYHIKRWDALWKVLTISIACFHWFNPLVWAMCILANRDLEISCDGWVTRKFEKQDKKMYAYMLVEMAEQRSEFTLFCSGFAKHAIEERIESIMKTNKTTWIGISVAALLIGVLALNAFATPADYESEAEIIAEFHFRASDEEISYVLAAINEHPLIATYEFISRYTEKERITEEIADGDDRLRELLSSVDTQLVDIVIIEVINIRYLNEVLEFVYDLDPIQFVIAEMTETDKAAEFDTLPLELEELTAEIEMLIIELVALEQSGEVVELEQLERIEFLMEELSRLRAMIEMDSTPMEIAEFDWDVVHYLDETYWLNYIDIPEGNVHPLGELLIPTIDARIPIYHGVGEPNITIGAGTMNPEFVMGEGNITLASHWDPNPEIRFGGLHLVEDGDLLILRDSNYLYIYETIIYNTVIERYQSYIADYVPGKNYLTLFTCTPDGANRLMVRGEFVERIAIADSDLVTDIES